jgi:hypothetical protein
MLEENDLMYFVNEVYSPLYVLDTEGFI